MCHRRVMILAAALAVLATVLAGVAHGAAPPAGYNTLQTISVFKDQDPGGWAGSSGGLEVTEWNTLPVDTTVTYNGLPSLRVNVKRRSTWWLAMITIAGWSTADLSRYYANGCLEFNIKGAVGGEVFYIGMKDRQYERVINGQLTEEVEQRRLITDYITLTTSWQHVSIPLAGLIDLASQFNTAQSWTVQLANADTKTLKFWINDIKFTSPDREKDYPNIKVDQVGYTTAAEKYALVTGWYEQMTAVNQGTPFQVRRTSDGAAVYSGTLTLLTDYEPNVSGEKMLKAEFSPLATPGTYYISVSGLPDSPPFAIGDNVYDQPLVDACRYYYLQRANIALTEPYAQGWPHEAWHLDDANCRLESTPGYKQDVHGGWYDAGDFGKYTTAAATAVSDLIWAYELFPSRFTDGQCNIPESGNGRPDLLDEIRYELDFLLRMQDPATGGFWSRVFPQNSKTDPRYISDVADSLTMVKPTAQSAAAVGALAHAYVLFRDLDPAYASTCLNAARAGWGYLQANPGLVPAPPGPYCDNDDANDRLWAAAELYRATGEAQFNQYFLANYANFAGVLDQPENAHGVGGMEIPAFFAYMKAANPDPAFVSWFTAKFGNWRTVQINRSNNGLWRNTLEDTDYYWGSNMPVLNTTMDLVIGSLILGNYDAAVRRVARANLHYVFGINPMCFSYLSGYGLYCHKNVYSAIYTSDMKPGAPPGYLSGGANMYEGRRFSKFNGKCYSDANTEWTTNEHTIYWNSGLVFSLALLGLEAGIP
ncbi:MAG: glycoside hydrolase family 9 protein [Bacteroidota bacterium]